jgi:molecular chaperone DnaK (HSP70)
MALKLRKVALILTTLWLNFRTMRQIVPIIIFLFLVTGCHPQNRMAIVVEDNTSIVSAGSTTESLGIETVGGMFTPLIKPGTTVPCKDSEVFSTAADGQSQIMVTLFRGTNELAASNHALGRFQVTGIPAAPRGKPNIQITFAITQQQILLSARDLNRGMDLQIHRMIGDNGP